MTTIQDLETEVKEHAQKIGVIIEDPSKIAAMLASRWEYMQNHQVSPVISLSILPLLESMDLVIDPPYQGQGGTAIDFEDFHEQIGKVRTRRWKSRKACEYHANLRRDQYYSS